MSNFFLEAERLILNLGLNNVRILNLRVVCINNVKVFLCDTMPQGTSYESKLATK